MSKQGTPNHPGYTAADQTGLPLPPTHKSSRRCCNPRCLVWICCSFLLIVGATIGIEILVEHLVLQPKDGAYALQEAVVNTFNFTTDGSTYSLDTDMALKILFTNPNHKMGFDIKGVTVKASYAGVVIAHSADVPPFHQGKRNETVISSELRNVTTLLSADDSLRTSSNVTLFVVMSAKVRNNHGFMVSMHPFNSVHLNCWVNVTTPNGSRPGTLISKSCSTKRGGHH